jgi:hypothetical protein
MKVCNSKAETQTHVKFQLRTTEVPSEQFLSMQGTNKTVWLLIFQSCTEDFLPVHTEKPTRNLLNWNLKKLDENVFIKFITYIKLK